MALRKIVKGKLSLSEGKKNNTKDQALPGDPYREQHRPFHERGEGLHPGAPHLYVKLVADSPLVLSLGRMCDELWFSYSWQTGGKPTVIKRARRPSNFVPLVAVTQQRSDPARRSPVPDNEVEDTESFSANLIEDWSRKYFER